MIERQRIGLRLEKRDSVSILVRVAVPVICILAAFMCCAVIIGLQGFNPLEVYARLIKGAYGTAYSISESVLQGIPLMLCGLGVSMAFKMSINNIGAEGQYAMGAFAATAVALFCPWIPKPLVLPAIMIAGFIGGAIWGMLAVAPRAFMGVNETIVTLMFNYIALYWVDYWCYGPWRDSSGSNMPYTKVFPEYAQLPTLWDTRIHIGLIIAVIAAALIYMFYRFTVRGYQMRVIGTNVKAARYAGMNINANIMLVMLLSGGLAGLAGSSYVSGVVYRLQPNLPNGVGYTAIIIAYLAKFNPFLVLVVAVLFGGLTQGGYSVQIMGVSSRVVTMIQGGILFFVLAGEIFIRNRLVLIRTSNEVHKTEAE
ncbi:MAG: ABC transporter permease [Clostridia bacterium]